ncbi:hypothetical protein [Salinibacter ruber]|uniref:hypothetical protein n=1 Tax=Salinibacter ruber TaxID=146919 RepID=UPI00216AA724|nr:hypothetical protein [Salinibacter ruber]MCS3665197.1 hypothetical protein [Salinibacter ruber]MCS3756060.1 hypothetical protein [Salinibacter ruber]
MPSWFERLTGFPETSPSQVRADLTTEGHQSLFQDQRPDLSVRHPEDILSD